MTISSENQSAATAIDNKKNQKPAPKRPRYLKWLGWGLFTPVAMTTALLGYGVNLDLTPYRTEISDWLTTHLDRTTQIQGDIHLTLSFQPAISLNGVTIANTDAFNWQPLVSSGKLEAQIALLPLLHHTIALEHLALEDIAVYLGKDAQGEANWLVKPLVKPHLNAQVNAQAQASELAATDSPAFTLALSNPISAKNLSLVYDDQQQRQYIDTYLHELHLAPVDSLDSGNRSASLSNDVSNTQWQLTANGEAIGQSYTLDLVGDLDSLINQQRGHLKMDGDFAGAHIAINADVQPPSQGQTQADVALTWQDTRPLASLLGLDIKYIAPLNITTRLHVSADTLSINELHIDSPVTQGSGQLDIALGQHNTIDGHLALKQIDLRPWLAPQPQMMMRAFGAPPQPSPLQQALDQWLNKTSTSLSVTIDEILGLGTPVENLSLGIEGDEGLLSAPVTADIANVPFRGEATLDATQWSSHLNITLGANNSPLGEMARWLTGIHNAQGHLDRAQLSVTTEGTKLSEWLDNSQLALAMDKAEVTWGYGAQLSIDKARLNAGLHVPFHSNIQGQLMGVPVNIDAQAGNLQDIMLGRDWPARLTVDSPAINMTAEGLLRQTRWQEGSWFDVDIQSSDAALLSPWLGTANVNGEINVDGKVRYENGWINLNIPSLCLLNSEGKMSLRWRPADAHPQTDTRTDAQAHGQQSTASHVPFLAVKADFSRLDLTQFGHFIDDEEMPQVEQTVPTQGVNLNVPLLGSDLVIADADLHFNADRFMWGKQSIDDLSFNGKIRDGKLRNAPIHARYAGSDIKGHLNAGINAAHIDAALNLSVEQPNIGDIAARFDIADDLDMRLQHAELSVAVVGRTLLELMEHTQVEALLHGGYAKLADTYTGKALTLNIDEGRFVTGPDTDTALTLSGNAANKPMALRLNSLSLKAANDGRTALPVDLAFSLGDMRVDASSQVALPVDPKKLNLTFHAFTPNLDRLEDFAAIDLPPYGPVTVNGKLAMDHAGYHLKDLLIQVNESQLRGNGAFIPPRLAGNSHKKADSTGTSNDRPTASLVLTAPFIQLDDFKVDDWQAWQDAKAADQKGAIQTDTAQKGTVQKTNEPTAQPKPAVTEDAKPASLISPDGLNALNARFSLAVDEVRSGKDWLGAGRLDWQLQDGVFTLNPLYIQLPGGNIHIDSTIRAKGEMFDIALNGKVDNFDYGVLARRLSPDTEMHGRVSSQFSLTSLANSPDTLLNNANGFLGFSVWPKAYDANLIDLWAVSLTDAIVPTFTNNDPSVLNCVAGGFDITNGTMKERDLLLDTTRIQVKGDFNASYAARDFSVYLQPQSKRAQIFSLQTPVEVFGEFEHFDFTVPLAAILETSVRFTTSPVISPLRWLLEKPLPRDGSDQCELIWQGKPINSPRISPVPESRTQPQPGHPLYRFPRH
ncbi:hypothetical protein GCM10007086_29410 [Photobacterium aphoticum]|nr:AsmA family protein [Photobacterium aphoticum]GHA53251.1 hypothetical protein GCM10007086_29410 [Photobacterium aphoticum]